VRARFSYAVRIGQIHGMAMTPARCAACRSAMLCDGSVLSREGGEVSISVFGSHLSGFAGKCLWSGA